MKTYYLLILLCSFGCSAQHVAIDAKFKDSTSNNWEISGQKGIDSNVLESKGLIMESGFMYPEGKLATMTTRVKNFSKKRSAKFLEIKQSPIWENWTEINELGTSNMADAPVFLRKSRNDFWIFSRNNSKVNKGFIPKDTILKGFDIPLKTTPIEFQFDALGALKEGLGGYHAWQSHDMVNWVHHGPVSDYPARWMTTAEQVGDKTYLYYDFPNDQDPHLIIDSDLTDGEIGKKMGMAFKDPSDGSDCAIIRDLNGSFHLILENWSPINASKRSWDSPLASHAVSKDGINDFKLVDPAVDYRTEPTGQFGEYAHPHWHKEDPKNYPGKIATKDVPQHRIKKGDEMAFATYEIHEPEQPSFGDWAAIAIGGQYYLFGDYDPVGKHGRENMETAWFTSSDINKPFEFCGSIGKGHPDPDIMFAKNQFYLISQTNDFVSPGPWVETVTARVGVDTNNNGKVDFWSAWQKVKETYDYIDGFSKQISKTPAKVDLSELPSGFGFQIEMKLEDSTDNESKPMIETLQMFFE